MRVHGSGSAQVSDPRRRAGECPRIARLSLPPRPRTCGASTALLQRRPLRSTRGRLFARLGVACPPTSPPSTRPRRPRSAPRPSGCYVTAPPPQRTEAYDGLVELLTLTSTVWFWPIAPIDLRYSFYPLLGLLVFGQEQWIDHSSRSPR